MIIYPDENYTSWISEDDADEYFETRLNAAEWDAADPEMALQTAFRSLNELDLDIDLDEDESPLQALKQAQCEQAIHELKNELDNQSLESMNLSGGLPVKIKPAPRYSERALAILRPYIVMPTVSRLR